MAIAVDKEMRERAKREGKLLFQLSIDARHLMPKQIEALRGKLPMGRLEITGPVGEKAARELYCWYRRHSKRQEI